MAAPEDEDHLLRSVALQNANSILQARHRAEAALLRSQDALRESQERLTAALAAAGTGTLRWDLRTYMVEWDGNLGRIFGLETGQTPQSLSAFIDAVHPDDKPGVVEQCKRCARDGVNFDMEFRVVWPDASVHWIDEKAKAFFDGEGRPLYMTGACAEITTPPSFATDCESRERFASTRSTGILRSEARRRIAASGLSRMKAPLIETALARAVERIIVSRSER